jgi:protein TonB
MPHSTDIFAAREPWGGSLFASLLFHSTIFGLILAYGAVMGFHPNDWGGSASGGGAIPATLVSAAAIPLPRETPTQNIVANESTGITKSEPKEVAPPEPKAIEIPKTIKVPEPKAKTHTTTERKPEPVQQATNVVPFGQNGQVRQNFSTFSTATGSGALSVGAGGDFGSRYSWYVDNVRRVVSQNWLMYEVDPHTTPKERVYLTFDIQRNGQPANVRIERSSGIPSLDSSAVRALQRIDTFGPLPNDYRGGSVSAEFYFDYSPMHR